MCPKTGPRTTGITIDAITNGLVGTTNAYNVE